HTSRIATPIMNAHMNFFMAYLLCSSLSCSEHGYGCDGHSAQPCIMLQVKQCQEFAENTAWNHRENIPKCARSMPLGPNAFGHRLPRPGVGRSGPSGSAAI